jgi:hypothetical protein
MKAAIFSSKGIGDGLVSLILSHNLHLNGYEVLTFHNGNLKDFQSWFPHLKIEKYPKIEKIEKILKDFSKIFISHDSSNDFVQKLIHLGKKKYKEKVLVMNPSWSKNFKRVLFYEDCFFKNDISMVENIFLFCRDVLNLKKAARVNGMKCPYDLVHRKVLKRVIIHPTAATKGRSWGKKKFLKLARKLKKRGFEVIFVISPEEVFLWKEKTFEVRAYPSLDDLSKLIYESGYMIGNDSGIGHLASCLCIPTVSIARSERLIKLWRPGFFKNISVAPFSFIPNISGFRLRDKKWKKFVSVRRVLKSFLKIFKEEKSFKIK